MTGLILFDDDGWFNLKPLTFTKPSCELRVGALRIREKWEHNLNLKASFITQDYLSHKFILDINDDNLIINGRLLPNPKLLELISDLKMNQSILLNGSLIAARLNSEQLIKLGNGEAINPLNGFELATLDINTKLIQSCSDIFLENGEQLLMDYELITKDRSSLVLDSSNFLKGSQIFIEEGTSITNCSFNTSEGPIYIGKNVTIMEGALLRGPLAIMEGSTVKMGAKIYKNTSIGPHCKVGGEISNVVFLGYSNKGHDGYLGNSVIGEWCNFGADTNCSNLKNNYSNIKVWSYVDNHLIDSGLQFCGLIMGDHSKTSINTMFNTGTTVGVYSNIVGHSFPDKFIPSFTWGIGDLQSEYDIDKSIETATKVMSRRDITFTTQDEMILRRVNEDTKQYRIRS